MKNLLLLLVLVLLASLAAGQVYTQPTSHVAAHWATEYLGRHMYQMIFDLSTHAGWKFSPSLGFLSASNEERGISLMAFPLPSGEVAHVTLTCKSLQVEDITKLLHGGLWKTKSTTQWGVLMESPTGDWALLYMFGDHLVIQAFWQMIKK